MATYPTPNSLFNIFSDLRAFLVAGFRSFPTAFAGTTLFLGLFTGNYAMLFFLMGLLLWVPLVNMGVNFLGGLLPTTWMGLRQGPVCNLVLKDSQIGEGVGTAGTQQLVSDWIAMTIFIFSYLFTNALMLYKLPVEYAANATADDKAATDEKAGLRKSRAVVSLIMILAVGLVFLTLRLAVSKCDSILGAVIGLLVYGGLGFGWYKALSKTGQDRLSDLFGVANRLLSPSALTNQPYACLPQAST
jgi:hypothetical protein